MAKNIPYRDSSIASKKYVDSKLPRAKKKYLFIRLWKYLYQFKWSLLVAAILTIASNVMSLIGPFLSGRAIDAVEPGAGFVEFNKVFYYCGLMIAFYIASSAISYIVSILLINLSQKVSYQMRKDVFERLVDLPVSYFDNHQTGDIISHISYDIDTVNASLSTDFIQLCTSFITVVGSFAMMVMISPMMVLVFVITIPVSILVTKYSTGKVRPLFRIRSQKLGELNGFVEEITSGQNILKVYHQEENITKKFILKNDEAVDSYYNAEYYGGMVGPSVMFINNLSLALVSVFGAILYLYRSISLGDVSSFVLYSRKFSGPINETTNIISELQSAFAAAERVFRLIDELPEKQDTDDAIELQNSMGNVALENVEFGYTPEKRIIHNFNLDVKSGSLIAIVGPTGAGKTTLINLLMRFYDVDNGTIFIDGTEIRQITRNSLRGAYTMVLQETWLFHGTIFENIAYGKENVTMDEVVAVAKAAKIHKYIMGLPKGYNTVLKDNGANISKGQKQLLTIARAMLLDSKMLILDEATSNVDTQTEIRIQKAMRNLMKDKTCFVIAHRLSTIKNADLILVVNNGDVVEQGTHEELMQRNGVYAELYYSQFEVY